MIVDILRICEAVEAFKFAKRELRFAVAQMGGGKKADPIDIALRRVDQTRSNLSKLTSRYVQCRV